jgi:hypothetical protein
VQNRSGGALSPLLQTGSAQTGKFSSSIFVKSFPIKPVQKGGTPTLLDTVFANQVLQVINALATMRVISPQGIASIKLSGDTAILDLANANFKTDTTIATLQSKLGQLINSIANSSLNVSCNPNTANINASMNYPNYPNANF